MLKNLWREIQSNPVVEFILMLFAVVIMIFLIYVVAVVVGQRKKMKKGEPLYRDIRTWNDAYKDFNKN